MQTKGNSDVKGSLRVAENAIFLKGVDTPYFEVVDAKTSGSAGGTFSPGEGTTAWRTRDLTVEVINDGFATFDVDNNRITLPKGTYYIEASCPAFAVDQHQAKLRDITNSADVIEGTSEFADSTQPGSQTRSFVKGRFSLSNQATLEIQHRCTSENTDDGLGCDAGFYVNNIYTICSIWQIKEN